MEYVKVSEVGKKPKKKVSPSIDILCKYFYSESLFLMTELLEYIKQIIPTATSKETPFFKRYTFVLYSYQYISNKYSEMIVRIFDKFTRYPFKNDKEILEFYESFYLQFLGYKKQLIQHVNEIADKFASPSIEETELQLESTAFLKPEAEMHVGTQMLSSKCRTDKQSTRNIYLSVLLGSILGIVGAILGAQLG